MLFYVLAMPSSFQWRRYWRSYERVVCEPSECLWHLLVQSHTGWQCCRLVSLPLYQVKVDFARSIICRYNINHWQSFSLDMCLLKLFSGDCLSLFSYSQTHLLSYSEMPTVRNARSLVTSRELPSWLQMWMKGQLFCLLPFAKCIVLSWYNECWHRQHVWRERQSN